MWLTDNTYKYEDLVRVMGEIISALEGKIRVSRGWLFSLSRCVFWFEVPGEVSGEVEAIEPHCGGENTGSPWPRCHWVPRAWAPPGQASVQHQWVRHDLYLPPVQTPTVVDYKEVLLALVPVPPRTRHLCSFLCELTLLHTSLSIYAPARLASAALLLARLTHGQSKEGPWEWGGVGAASWCLGSSWIRG